MMPINVLIVEDDMSIAEVLRAQLAGDRFYAAIVRNSEEAKRFLLTVVPDIVLLNLALRNDSPAAFANRLYLEPHTKDIPLVMLGKPGGAWCSLDELILGVGTYVARPPLPGELVSCIDALMRRQRILRLNDDPVSVGGLRIEPAIRSAFFAREGVRAAVRLSQNEFGLLYFLMLNPGRVYTRIQLLDEVWAGRDIVDTRAVDSTIRRLRTSLRRVACDGVIQAVHGFGYKFTTQGGSNARSPRTLGSAIESSERRSNPAFNQGHLV
jgi:two-component system, OmpR family, phosphate regulon response regulator PhoB